jgi:hypothetical protein
VFSALLVAECSLIVKDSSPPRAWRERTTALEAQLPKNLAPGAVLAVRTPTADTDVAAWIFGQVDAEVAAVEFGIPTLNGYSGNTPATWRTMSTCNDIGHNIRAGRHFLTEHGLPAPEIALGQLVLVGFGACDLTGMGSDPPLNLGRTYHFAQGGDGDELVADGFFPAEDWGRWTQGENAFLFFALQAAPVGSVSLSLEAISFSRAADRRQAVTILANGRNCAPLIVANGVSWAQVTCPAGSLRSGNNAIQLRIAHPIRPADVGVSNDWREIGLGLKTLTIAEIR